MSVATVLRYTKADFDKIQMDGFSYTLSPDTMKIIQEIANQVGSPEYIKTPQFEKRENININESLFIDLLKPPLCKYYSLRKCYGMVSHSPSSFYPISCHNLPFVNLSSFCHPIYASLTPNDVISEPKQICPNILPLTLSFT